MIKDKLILVDVDGVLLDWEYSFHKWIRERKSHLWIFDENAYKVEDKLLYKIDYSNITRQYANELSKEFNESSDIGYLLPLRDSIKYVKKLHEEHGYMFHAITSQSNRISAQRLRISNLESLFGKVFTEYTILGTGDDKDEVLVQYEDSSAYWIEDKPENVDIGISLGLTGILVAHPHNVNYDEDAIRLDSWKEIYEYITE
jgi:FMN phosphatase YigB (HAD superfamily)